MSKAMDKVISEYMADLQFGIAVNVREKMYQKYGADGDVKYPIETDCLTLNKYGEEIRSLEKTLHSLTTTMKDEGFVDGSEYYSDVLTVITLLTIISDIMSDIQEDKGNENE